MGGSARLMIAGLGRSESLESTLVRCVSSAARCWPRNTLSREASSRSLRSEFTVPGLEDPAMRSLSDSILASENEIRALRSSIFLPRSARICRASPSVTDSRARITRAARAFTMVAAVPGSRSLTDN